MLNQILQHRTLLPTLPHVSDVVASTDARGSPMDGAGSDLVHAWVTPHELEVAVKAGVDHVQLVVGEGLASRPAHEIEDALLVSAVAHARLADAMARRDALLQKLAAVVDLGLTEELPGDHRDEDGETAVALRHALWHLVHEGGVWGARRPEQHLSLLDHGEDDLAVVQEPLLLLSGVLDPLLSLRVELALCGLFLGRWVGGEEPVAERLRGLCIRWCSTYPFEGQGTI
jgi:hypothetical protein